MFTLDQKFTNEDSILLQELITGMRGVFNNGGNAMEYARKFLKRDVNLSAATLIAYDLQAGTYVKEALANPESKSLWCKQLAMLVSNYLPFKGSLIEVGVGEATTLAGLLAALPELPSKALGFDISWSRCMHARNWLNSKNQSAELFVADLFHIPLADSSVDVVYTSHSLEPNGGREKEALKELIRIARRAVVLIEPIFELADSKSQERMKHHGYVRNLKSTAEALGCKVTDYRLLEYSVNPLNPSGTVCIEKPAFPFKDEYFWRCPVSHTPLNRFPSAFSSASTGLVYPILDGIPLLGCDNAVLASAFGNQTEK
jgi:ubiquinone/menaquinone biosynthesis C-methylase UbiE